MMADPLQPVVSAYAHLFEQLAIATTGRTRKGPDGTVLAVSGSPVAALNAIISPSLEPDPDEIATLADAESWDCPWSIHVRGNPGPQVTKIAAQHGLTEFSQEPLMIRRPEQGLPEESAIKSLRVRPIAPDEFAPYAEAVAQGFGAPSGTFEVFNSPGLRTMDGLTFYLAELDGVPAGTGLAAISGDLTGIYNITTFPQYRRRGFGRAITMELVRAGFAAGAPTAYLYASRMGQPVYESAGFTTEEQLTVITAG